MEPSWPQVGQFTSFSSPFSYSSSKQFHTPPLLLILFFLLLTCCSMPNGGDSLPFLSFLVLLHYFPPHSFTCWPLRLANGSQDGISRPRDVGEITRLIWRAHFQLQSAFCFKLPSSEFVALQSFRSHAVPQFNCRLEFDSTPRFVIH